MKRPSKAELKRFKVDPDRFAFTEIKGEPRKEREKRRAREYGRWYYSQQIAMWEAEMSSVIAHPAVPEPLTERAADAFISWCESTLRVPRGAPLAGEPFALADWQQSFVRDALAPDTYRAGLSVARKNGKSALVSALILAHLAGPLNRPGWRAAVVSLGANHAREVREAVVALAEASGMAAVLRVRVTPHPGAIIGRNGARADFLASDLSTGHAISADLAIIDEAGLLSHRDRPLWNQLLGSLAGRDGRLLAISVRARGPMFAELAEAADAGVAGHVWHEYSHPGGGSIEDIDAIRAANPGIAQGIVSEQWLLIAASAANRSASDRTSFRVFHLNQRTTTIAGSFISPEDWSARAQPVSALADAGKACFVGIDVGDSVSGSAVAFYWPTTGRFEVRMWLVAPEGDIDTRARDDGVGDAYAAMVEEGTVDVVRHPPSAEVIAGAIETVLAQNPGLYPGQTPYAAAIGADTYRHATIQRAVLSRVNAHRFEARGLSTGQESDIRAFEEAFHAGRLVYEDTRLMREALSGVSREVRDSGAYLTKGWSSAVIDPVHAAIIAVGMSAKFAGIRDDAPQLGYF